MNRRSVSCQVLLSFLMMVFLVVTFGCSSSDSTPPAPATASATYTWDSGTDELTITWTSSNIPCNAPPAGLIQTEEDVTITTTTMTWPNENDGDGMTWTRTPAGAADDPAGTWTSTDPRGNTYTAVITATNSSTGSISLSATIIVCRSGDRNPGAETVYLPQEGSNKYRVDMWYDDPGHLATAVSVAGPGITGSTDLAWNWGTTILLENTSVPTDLPYTYTFSITPTATKTVTVSCFLQEYATNLVPTGTIYATPANFNWTGISATTDADYEIVLFDSGDNEIWRKKHISGTSVAYDGPSLTAGMTYHYDLFARSYSTCPDGYSRVGRTFTYNPE